MQKVRKTERQGDDWTDKSTDQRTTTLHPGPVKQTEIIIVPEETVFMQTLAVLPLTPIIFGIKHFDRSSSFLEFLP